jgi:hypothetical protein
VSVFHIVSSLDLDFVYARNESNRQLRRSDNASCANSAAGAVNRQCSATYLRRIFFSRRKEMTDDDLPTTLAS